MRYEAPQLFLLHTVGVTTNEMLLVCHQDGSSLTSIQVAARYDLTSMLLLRAWYAPWTPESHDSFGKPFRSAVTTLMLCAHRVGLPVDMAMVACQFLAREWWPEDKPQCWCHDCISNDAVELVQDKILQRLESASSVAAASPVQSREPPTLFSCPTCKIAKYCSPEHQKSDYHAGHLYQCGKPPFRMPGQEEEALCRQIFDGNDTEKAVEVNAGSEHGEVRGSDGNNDSDDESSWESIDSQEEEQVGNTTTSIVYGWFYRKAYSNDRIEPLELGSIGEEGTD